LHGLKKAVLAFFNLSRAKGGTFARHPRNRAGQRPGSCRRILGANRCVPASTRLESISLPHKAVLAISGWWRHPAASARHACRKRRRDPLQLPTGCARAAVQSDYPPSSSVKRSLQREQAGATALPILRGSRRIVSSIPFSKGAARAEVRDFSFCVDGHFLFIAPVGTRRGK